MKRIGLALLTIVASAAMAFSQEVTWSVDMNALFDNREGDSRYTDTKTFLQTQVSPEIGLSIMDGTHSIAAGVVWTQPFDRDWAGYKVAPTVYYRYDTRKVKFAFGMFPRTQLKRKLPNYIWNDSTYYSQRNISGAMLTTEGEHGFFEGVLDWRGLQSKSRREAFNIIAQGEWWPESSKRLLVGGVAMMNHFALSEGSPEDQHIVDNFIVNPTIGVNLSHDTGLDSLVVKVGMLSSLTRNRADERWRTPAGAWVEADLEWRWIGLKNTFYYGGRLFPYYSEHGALLDQGEPFYASKYYERATVYFTFLRNEFVNLQGALDFNVAKDNFTFYQRLVVRVYLDQDIFKKKSGQRRKLPSYYI